MIACAPLSPGLDVVTVEELHYGKLVVSRHGQVPAGEGYATTYRTTGFMHVDRVLPTKLLDGAHLQQDDIEKPFDSCGALYFRRVDKTFVVMRVRYRAESGEGRPGRRYLQACVRQIIAPRGFADVPPAFIPWTGNMLAEPDVEKRLDARAITTEFALPSRLTREILDSWQPARQKRIAGIVHAMRRAERIVIGRDLFDAPDQPVEALVGEFLIDVELALTLTGQGRQPVSHNFRIACGLSADIGGASLILSLTERSTAPSEARWRDLVAMVRPAILPRSQPSVPPASTRIPLARRAALIESARSAQQNLAARSSPNSGPGSAEIPAEPLSSDRLPPISAPLRDRAVPAEEGFTAAHPPPHSVHRHDDTGLGHFVGREITPAKQLISIETLLTRFGCKFQEAGVESRGFATLELFDIAADPHTHDCLEGWDPFHEETPSKATDCLGLLVGLYVPRNDILDRFTLPELLCVFPYVKSMPVSSGRSGWVDRLVSRIDARISEVVALTPHEFFCIKRYVCANFFNRLSANSRCIIMEEGEYLDPAPVGSFSASDRGDHAVAESALGRMRSRHEKRRSELFANQLILGTSQNPDIFNLSSRQSAVEESQILLADELDSRRLAVRPLARY